MNRNTTHVLELADAALAHSTRGCPRWAAHTFTKAHMEAMLHDETQKSPPKKDAVPSNGKMQKRRKRGGGGAWRAFIHVQAQQVGAKKPDFQTLAAAFHQLSPEQMAHYTSLGERAARLHRCGKSFPKTMVQARKAVVLRRTEGSESLQGLLRVLGHQEAHPGQQTLFLKTPQNSNLACLLALPNWSVKRNLFLSSWVRVSASWL